MEHTDLEERTENKPLTYLRVPWSGTEKGRGGGRRFRFKPAWAMKPVSKKTPLSILYQANKRKPTEKGQNARGERASDQLVGFGPHRGVRRRGSDLRNWRPEGCQVLDPCTRQRKQRWHTTERCTMKDSVWSH